MEKLTNLIFMTVCVITLFTVWKIHRRCKKVISAAGTRYAQLTSNGQFTSRWLLTIGAVVGLLWGRDFPAENFFYLAIASYLLSAYRYYKVGGWLGALLGKLNW